MIRLGIASPVMVQRHTLPKHVYQCTLSTIKLPMYSLYGLNEGDCRKKETSTSVFSGAVGVVCSQFSSVTGE